MNKLYFIKSNVRTQAERMADKYNYLWHEIEWLIEDNTISIFKCNELYRKIDYYKEKEEKINNALYEARSHGSAYKAEWKYIEILKKAASERDNLDNEINFVIDVKQKLI